MTKERRGAVVWVIALTALVATIGVIALLGGFRKSDPLAALQVEPGELVSVTRWDLTVDSCEHRPPGDDVYAEFGEVVVRGTATNTSDTSLPSINPRTFLLNLPNGERFGGAEGEFYIFAEPLTGGPYDPQIPAEYEITASLGSDEWPEDGAEVKIQLGDEFQRDGFLVGGSWEASVERAYLWLPCPTTGGP